jgi:hypothetical protein
MLKSLRVKLIIILSIVLFVNIVLGQELRLSKDTLDFTSGFVHDSWDTVYVVNVGDKSLFIDEIYSINHYGYQLYIYYKDTVSHYYIFVSSDLMPSYAVDFTLEPDDTSIFVFSAPDLCPMCKNSLVFDSFIDSIIIHSNSMISENVFLFAEGIGYSMDINTENEKSNIVFQLNHNYPNPFNPTTTIEYSLPKRDYIALKVYNMLGQEVATLTNESKPAGNYSVEFNAGSLASGIYIYTLQAGNLRKSHTMMLLK